MQFKQDIEPIYTDNPFYDLFEGGYIKPEDLLSSEEDIKKVKAAIETIKTFFSEAEEQGLIEFC